MDVRERAAFYINIKPRTRMQVIKYLRDKGFEENEIMETVKELEQYHYIDDLQYSQLYFEMCFDKGRGISRIRRELRDKGVSKEIIDEAFANLEEIPDQEEMALQIGRTVVEGINTEDLSWPEKQKLQAKVARKLASRGYSQDVVYKVIHKLI